ncbi:MAG: hypothetical protein ACJ76N_02100 [Thermoanaerobaculia bacterium]
MRSTVRQIAVVLLLAVLLAPGLLQARTPVRSGARSSQTVSTSPARARILSLDQVWSLLTGWLKTGPTLDPSGGGTGSSTSTTGDTGPVLDPSGTK